jgi:hypothetical protein
MNAPATMANVRVGLDSKNAEGAMACQMSCSSSPSAGLLPSHTGLAAKTDHMKAGLRNTYAGSNKPSPAAWPMMEGS